MGLAVGLISVLLLLWDFLTYPFYLIWDRPWRETRSQRIYLCTKRFMILCRLIERTRARIVDSKPDEVTIEPLPIESKMKVFPLKTLARHNLSYICRKSYRMLPRRSTQWRDCSNTRAKPTRTRSAWAPERFSGSSRRSRRAGRCSPSSTWASTHGRPTMTSPHKLRI